VCGIVGYIGPREAGPILIEGLSGSNTAGYDSAGIALVDERGDLFVEKRAGKLANLQTAIATGRRTPRSASRTPAGRPTVARTTSTPIPTRTARATSRSSTTGSSRTSASCATGSRRAATRLTSETDTEAVAHLVEEAYAATSPTPCGRAAPARGRVRARRHAQGEATGSSARAETCRSSSG
jgi:glucosamine--fructose-6-phosphate aminotransferase (isomerizing)